MSSRLPVRFKWLFAAAIAAILLVGGGHARAPGVLLACAGVVAVVCRGTPGAPPIGVWEWNPADGSVACPPELLGFEAAKRRVFTSSQLGTLVHADDYARLTATFENAAREKTAFDAEFRVVWPDGALHWLVVKGSGTAGVVLDITSIRQPEAALRESERRFRNAFEEAAVGMVILDAAGHIQSVNRGFSEIMQYSAAEVAGTQLMLLASPEQHSNMEQDRRLIAEGAMPGFRRERRFIRKDGVGVCVRTSVAALVLDGKPHTVGLMEDITEQKEARDQLNRQALHDPLTGLANRLHFEETLQTAIRTAGAGEIALLYIDLDGFKLVNDTLGHRAGDLVLKEVASRIGKSLQGAGLLARIGGDEFTIVMKDIGGDEEATAAAERVIETFRTLFRIEGHEVSIGASIGISRYPLDGKDASALLQSADAAMYCAKRSGNNRYQLFTAQMRQEAYQRLVMEMCLRNALEHREISVHYQPQYELATGKLAGFEALCRWTNAAMGPISPDRFIPLAEETGLIVDIGKHVLREACRQALEWQTCHSAVRVAVNVSATQFARPDFVNSVIDVLQETGLKPALLELEMTESSVIQDREDAVRKMQDLRRLGVRFSIDDFGTGYSSLSYIQYMPVDVLKIDRSFTAKLGTSRRALSMVRAIIAMARALGLRVVTEGVEKPAQVAVLRELGCDDVQGYYFGKPESGEASVARALKTNVLVEDEELAGVAQGR